VRFHRIGCVQVLLANSGGSSIFGVMHNPPSGPGGLYANGEGTLLRLLLQRNCTNYSRAQSMYSCLALTSYLLRQLVSQLGPKLRGKLTTSHDDTMGVECATKCRA
jgi:hypothetical protein